MPSAESRIRPGHPPWETGSLHLLLYFFGGAFLLARVAILGRLMSRARRCAQTTSGYSCWTGLSHNTAAACAAVPAAVAAGNGAVAEACNHGPMIQHYVCVCTARLHWKVDKLVEGDVCAVYC